MFFLLFLVWFGFFYNLNKKYRKAFLTSMGKHVQLCTLLAVKDSNAPLVLLTFSYVSCPGHDMIHIHLFTFVTINVIKQ